MLSPRSTPLGLYVHCPFCRRKCHYCDFYSLAQKPDAQFTQALLQELQHWKNLLDAQKSARGISGPAQTLYFGGGTPSQLADEDIATIIKAASQWPGLAQDAEITLEANPMDIALKSCQNWRHAGVNRLSMGLQSLDDRWLKFLGRLHSAEQARQAVATARDAGFKELSLDLMVALPGQSLKAALADVDALLQLNPDHISVYTLIIEATTPLGRLLAAGQLQAPEDDLVADIFAAVIQRVETAGLRRYEISNFARPGHEARHNMLYWSRAEYIGLGPAAHSLLYHNNKSHRLSNPASLQAYEQNFLQHDDVLWNKQQRTDEWLDTWPAVLESLAFGLRNLLHGICLDDFSTVLTAQQISKIKTLLHGFVDAKWIIATASCYQLTPQGAAFADAVARDILALADEDEASAF